MTVAATDRRVERTRQALLGAFIAIMFEGRRYDRIRIADVIARAGVGRSTFYEHYPNKEALLAETIRMPFAPLAEAVDADAQVGTLAGALTHFHQNRVHGRAVFAGATGRRVTRILADMIEQRLRARARANGVIAPGPLRTGAIALAEGQLAAIFAWLGEGAATVEPLAATLHRIAQAVAAELCDR
ncbi:MAG TPA: helix-turn-helix domain-containing protein [Rhodanobacteraceae bacterium]